MKHLALFALLFLTASTLAAAENNQRSYLDRDTAIGILHNVQVIVQDGVTDHCWTNVKAVENRIRAKLEQAGIRTYEEPLAFPNGFSARLLVSTNGFRVGDSLCVGNLSYDVLNEVSKEFGSTEHTGHTWAIDYLGIMFSSSSLHTNANRLNEDFLSQTDAFTDELIASIYSGRRNEGVTQLLQAMPGLTDEAMTWEEFRDAISEYSDND